MNAFARSSALLVSIMAALALVGCGPDCVSLCEQMDDECDDDEINLDTHDCPDVCDDIDKITIDEKCEEELDAMLSCIEEQKDICDYGDKCDDEVDDWVDCGCDGNNADDCARLQG